MRKIGVLAALIAAGLAVYATGAFAANVYRVSIAAVSPTNAGTVASPTPIRLNFGYKVTTDDGNRPAVSTDYTIGFGPGVRQNRRFFRRCTNARAGFNAGGTANCPANALVGQGRVSNQAGLQNQPSQKIPCNLRLRLYNGDARFVNAAANDGRRVRADVWLVLNGGPNDPALSNCPLTVNPSAIPAQFVRYLGGTALRFHVPRTPFQQPQAGVDNAVVDVTSSVNRKTTRVATRIRRDGRFVTVFRTRGFFETTRCPAGGHPVNVRFTDTTGAVKNAPTKRAPCRP